MAEPANLNSPTGPGNGFTMSEISHGNRTNVHHYGDTSLENVNCSLRGANKNFRARRARRVTA